jgi:hypothetical protein
MFDFLNFNAVSLVLGCFCSTIEACRGVIGLDGEIGRHSGLKIRRFVHSGRTGSIPVRGTIDSLLLF